jgi:diguanylate cyclase (GGDEF)-like protein
MDELMEQITSKPDYRALGEKAQQRESTRDTGDVVSDELEELGEKIRSMQREMRRYLDYVRAQAYTDALTGVGNTAAYLALQRVLEEGIETRTGEFALAVFDINLLKLINDRHGHQRGDEIIRGAAQAIETVFGLEQTFRTGGDEFVAVAFGLTAEEMEQRLRAVDEAVEDFNCRREEGEGKLSLSKGSSFYRWEEDGCFKDVFSREDEMMYGQKGEFHRKMGKLARRYEWLDE